MTLTKVIKVQLKADEQTFAYLDGQSKICNWLYNCLLEKANELKKEFIETGDEESAKTVYTERGLRNLIPALKKEYPFLCSVYSSPLKNAALRLSSAIQAHQKCKKGKRKGTSGWPKFRSWKTKWFSLLYDEPNKGFKIVKDTLVLSLGIDKEGKRLRLELQIKEPHLLRNQTLRNLRIVKEAGFYYAIFTVQTEVCKPKPIQKMIALDPNHKNLAYGVDLDGKAIEIAAPHFLKIHDTRIDELKSKRDRCSKTSKEVPILDENGQPTDKIKKLPSRRWRKYHKALERALHKRREQTKSFMFTVAHSLCQKYDCVGIGNYTPNGSGKTTSMRRAMNNRSLIGRFKEILSWTAQKSGKTYIEYDETGTTRTCHACGYRVEEGLDPSIRDWVCPSCCTEHIRDENAAINGLQKILRDLKTKILVPCSGLVSVMERWAWRVLPGGIEMSLSRQERRSVAASRN